MTCIAITYPDPDIPARQAVGVAIAVLNKIVDDTDNQKKVETAENKPLCALSGTQAKVTEKTFQEMYINVGMANCEKRPKPERDDIRFTHIAIPTSFYIFL